MEKMEWSAHAAAVRVGSRRDKRNAVAALKRKVCNAEGDAAVEAFEELKGALVACIDDEAESCREDAVAMCRHLLTKSPASEYRLAYVVPPVSERLANEPSEEVRLALVRLICDMVAHAPLDAVPHRDCFFNAASTALGDEYANVCHEGCRLVELLVETLPQHFHERAEALLVKACALFSHRHSKLRAAAVQCVGVAVLKGNAECLKLALSEIPKPLLDDSTAVRLVVAQQLGSWIVAAPDRYSYFCRIIPCLLTGVCDEDKEVSSEATAAWEKAGLQYEKENEDNLLFIADYQKELSFRRPAVPRPNLGCRTLVSKNLGQITLALKEEMNGWQAETRFRAAQILRCTVLHAELKCVQYTSVILDCFLRAANDIDARVIDETKLAAEYLGYFVEPKIWWNYLMGDLDSLPGLVVLANLIKGSDGEHLKDKYLKRIARELSCNRLLDVPTATYKMNMLHICESLMNVCDIHCQNVSQDIFNILFNMYAMPLVEEVEHRALCLIGKLRETIRFGSNIEDLYSFYIRSLLVNITSDATFWTEKTRDKFILKAILLHTGSAIGLHLHLISPLLVEILASSVTPEIQLDIFTSLCSMLLQRDERLKLTDPDKLNSFMNVIINDIIIRHLNWHAGLTAEALRTIAVCCLCAILQDNSIPTDADGDIDFQNCVQPIDLFPDQDSLQTHVNTLFPLLVELVKDNSKKTRQYSLQAIRSLVKLAKNKDCFKVEHLHGTYSDILTRLNDPTDKVRRSAVETLCILFMARPEPYDIDLFNSHIDALYSAMLSHLDDPDTMFQENVLDALKRVCSVHPKLLKGKVDASIKLFKNQKALEHLDKHLESLSI